LVTVLNLIWLLVSIAALGALWVSEHGRSSAGMSRMQRLMAVLLVTVSLFPCVSASDDVISFAYVSAGLETRSGFGHSIPNENSDNASGIYLTLQNLEHLQISAFYTFLVAICFFGFVFVSAQRSVFRQSPLFVSRAPPQPAS
jgi:hypothetical protein